MFAQSSAQPAHWMRTKRLCQIKSDGDPYNGKSNEKRFCRRSFLLAETNRERDNAFLGRQDPLPKDDLRIFLHEKLGDLAVKWYRKGFNRGHKESHAQTVKGRMPNTLRHDATRQFFTGGKRTVHLKSVLP